MPPPKKKRPISVLIIGQKIDLKQSSNIIQVIEPGNQSVSVPLIGQSASIKQSRVVVQEPVQPVIINQSIKLLGQGLNVAKSHVTVYLGEQVATVNTSGSVSFIVGTPAGVTAYPQNVQGLLITGRIMNVVNNSPSIIQLTSVSTINGVTNILVNPIASGTGTITCTCDGVIGTITCVVTGVVSGDMFLDTFIGGFRAASQNGISYGAHVDQPNFTPNSILSVAPDAGSPTGYSLDAAFGTIAYDGAFHGAFTIEENLNLPSMEEIFIEQTTYTDPDTFHRNCFTANNNKHLRLWDANYSGSKIHLGYSVYSKSIRQTTTQNGTGTGAGSLVVEWDSVVGSPAYVGGPIANTGAGNWGTGPYTTVFTPGTETKIGFYVHRASEYNIPDGTIKVWVNDALVYDYSNKVNICMSGGVINLFQHGFIFGPANSGFGQLSLSPVNPSHYRVRKLRIRPTAPY